MYRYLYVPVHFNSFQPPGPPASAARPPHLLAAKQEASDRTVRAPEPAQETTGSPIDPAFAQRVQADRAARVTVAAHAGSPKAALDALASGQTREPWEGALRDLARATDQRSKERWNEALATALLDPGGRLLCRRWVGPPGAGSQASCLRLCAIPGGPAPRVGVAR